MTKPFLSIRDLCKSFGDVNAVDHVNIDVGEGEFLTFLGPSGSGKSTTLYAIAGFEDPTSGQISLAGKSLLTVPSHKRNIGMVFQRYTLFPHLSVGENIAFPLRVRKHPESTIQETVSEMLALVRLEGFADRLPHQLSGGQQQRVALARALSYRPPLLLMDEPLAALDKKLREEIQIELRHIHRQTGVTILYVTHDQEEALRLSDRIAVFNAGKIEQIADGKTLYMDPATRFVAGFIGDSNFLKIKDYKIDKVGQASVIFPDGSTLYRVRCHSAEAKQQAEPALMVRPQALNFTMSQKTAGGMQVSIKDVTFLGDKLALQLQTSWGQEIWANGANVETSTLAIGGQGWLSLDPDACHVFR